MKGHRPHLAIDTTCWNNRRGFGRFTRELVTAMVRVNEHFDITLLGHDEIDGLTNEHVRQLAVRDVRTLNHAATTESRRSLKELSVMSRAATGLRADLFFFPAVYSFYPLWNCGKMITVFHDTIAHDMPDLIFRSRRERLAWNAKSWFAARFTALPATVSETMRQPVARMIGVDPEKVFVINEAPADVFRAEMSDASNSPTPSHLPGNAPYFVHVGGFGPHKNLRRLVRAFAALRRRTQQGAESDIRLVLVGDTTPIFSSELETIRADIGELGLRLSVIFTGLLDDSELVSLLKNSRALIMPSLAEGYGLPIIEAAAAGVETLASRNIPATGFLGGETRLFDPTNVTEIENVMWDTLNDPDRKGRGIRARKLVESLTWEASAVQLLSRLEML